MHLARFILALTLVIAAGLGCAAASEPKREIRPDWPTRVDALFPGKTRDIMDHATSVTVYDVRASRDNGPPSSIAEVAGFKASAEKEVPPKVVQNLLAVLEKDESYMFGKRTRCMFRPAVAYRFMKGQDSVTIVLCFGCDEALITDSSGHSSWVMFLPSHDVLLALSEAALREGSPAR
jgi:hypothetical protein